MKGLTLLEESQNACSGAPAKKPLSYEPLRGCGDSSIDSIYIHVPFCASKCHYCDFYSLAGHLDRAEGFLAALEREMAWYKRLIGTIRPRTLFIGGGTPTLLADNHLKRLLPMLQEFIDSSGVKEFTVEANPNTFTPQKAHILRAAGVGRISFGAQSFNPSELRTLERDHEPESVPAAVKMARDAGVDNINLDLIFGIPGQSLASWEHSLSRALELAPSHLSCYSLTYEPTTVMTARLLRGEFQKIDEETELAMFEHVYRRLRDAGFIRYEVSNYARSSAGAAQVALHNLVYWKAGNWLGLGPSAGSHIARPTPDARSDDAVAWQWKNVGSLAHYLEAFKGQGSDAPPWTQQEALSRKRWAGAAAVFWLRLNEGINYQAFAARTGIDAQPILRSVLGPFIEQSFAEVSAEGARLTERGVVISNHILSRVLRAFES